MTTRAGAANQALRAKEEIVRLLHGYQHHHSLFSFEDLRSAFLKRAQEIHPDKVKSDMKNYHLKEFITLKESWDRYEKVSKLASGIGSTNGSSGNFTMFGVGCSFSDSESEKLERNKIMDEAARGWFSAGEIQESNGGSSGLGRSHSQQEPLIGDDLFQASTDPQVETGHVAKVRKPSLVSHPLAKPKH